MSVQPRPLALIILDGWGHREETDFNAIAAANKPFWDQLLKKFPHTLISGCGRCVGLPDDQMGNSEVGHLNIGAGRVVYQDLTRIDAAIEEGEFFSNPVLVDVIEKTKAKQTALHVFGLVSPGGVHSHERQIHAFIKMAAERELTQLYIHAFLDGRDTPPKSAAQSLETLQDICNQTKCGKIVSIIGRYYVMDRDKRWERVQAAYDLFTTGNADCHASDALTALEAAYSRNETDEFVKPTTIGDTPTVIKDGDSIVFMNFRADRAREITSAFVDTNFTGFKRNAWPQLDEFISLTEYDANLATLVAFPPKQLTNIFSELLSNKGLQQLKIAETEKYAHVTFFFNGGREEPFPGEDRILIPSPKVATYDLKPEMSAYEVTDQLVKAIKEKKYAAIICNFANPDMVGHTGNLAAATQAIEVIDQCLEKIITALQAAGGEALITADHGNAEMMFDRHTGQPHTAHTHELVPLIYVGRTAKVIKENGVLSDVAPTMLYLMGISPPAEMTGQPVFELTQ